MCEALNKEESPLSEGEVHFIQMCCCIMKVSESYKIKFIATSAAIEGEGNPGLTIAIIKKMLEALGSEAEACRRDSTTLPMKGGEPLATHGWIWRKKMTSLSTKLT